MGFPTRLFVTALGGALLVAVIGFSREAVTQDTSGGQAPPGLDEQLSGISGDPGKPRRHFRVRNPAQLEDDEARDIYGQVVDQMVAGYALSGDPSALAYRSWRRYNRVPFLSATHGKRYINHYANYAARDYGRYEQAGRMPVGAIIAKDSFSVTQDGAVHDGPLFLMEKLAEGFNEASGDWRYTLIMPDGSVFGVTKGVNADAVAFCVGCHLMRENYDHLYFPPRADRLDF